MISKFKRSISSLIFILIVGNYFSPVIANAETMQGKVTGGINQKDMGKIVTPVNANEKTVQSKPTGDINQKDMGKIVTPVNANEKTVQSKPTGDINQKDMGKIVTPVNANEKPVQSKPTNDINQKDMGKMVTPVNANEKTVQDKVTGGINQKDMFIIEGAVQGKPTGDINQKDMGKIGTPVNSNEKTVQSKSTGDINQKDIGKMVTPVNSNEKVVQWNPKCDINNDFVIDKKDMDELSSRYNTTPTSNNWNAKCDINKDNIVDIFDITILSRADGQRINPVETVSAKEIALRIDSRIRPEFEKVIKSDQALLDFYNSSTTQQKRQITFESNQLEDIKLNEMQAITYNASFGNFGNSTLGELNRQLITIGIPTSLRYGLLAEGAAISGALADGPLPFGDIAAIVISIGVGFIILYNWDILEEKSGQIIDVFNNTFKEKFSVGYIKMEYAISETLELVENAAEENARSLPLTGAPNSTKERVKDGKVIQRRHYNEEGKARVDEDFADHGTPHLHSNPHYHKWDWSTGKGKRGKTINWFDNN